MRHERYMEIQNQAKGSKKAQTVFKNVNVVDVLSGKITQKDVAVFEDIFLGVGEYSGEQEIDLTGKYICPGFINSHLHIESTMVLPSELLKYTIRNGTTTYIADPHEAANVKGNEGIDFMLEQTKDVPANVYFMAPSCVPATDVDDNGAILGAKELEIYRDNPRIKGIGEVMDTSAVMEGDRDLIAKMDIFRDKILDGHAPNLSAKKLNAYVAAGIKTDHEAHNYEYALMERSAGLHVQIREGSAATNLTSIVRGIVENNTPVDGFSYCTDDKHIEDIIRDGEISCNVRRSIELGLSPIKAIKMATINAANCYNLPHLGAISPGRQADFLVLDDLEKVDIRAVYHKGKLAWSEEHDVEIEPKPISPALLHTIKIPPISKNTFELKNEGEEIAVIEVIDRQILTKKVVTKIPNKNGIFEPNKEFSKIVNVERHHATGKIGIGVIKNFGIQNGAVATSVSHDSHNILAAADNDEDMCLAVKEIQRLQGGYAIASGGKILSSLELPVMGLMNDKGFEYVRNKLREMLYTTRNLGLNENIDPFITLSFMALPVIPEIRITPRGVFDVVSMKFLNRSTV